MKTYTFEISIKVDSVPALRKAAHQRAIEEGADPTEVHTIEECLIMLLDPGSLAGCSIYGSEVECYKS